MAKAPDPIIGGFKGLNNRLDPTALGPQWQLQADNVLCDMAGYYVRRPGYSAVIDGISDGFGTKDERLFLVTSGGALLEDGRERASGFLGAPFRWAELGTAVFALSDSHAWAIYPDRVVRWGIPTLPAPHVVPSPGALPRGIYQAAAILVAPDGRIGGCSGTSRVESDGAGGFSVWVEPVNGYTARLYLSEPDGAALYAVGVLPPDGEAAITAPLRGSYELVTQHLYPPPHGIAMSSHLNRIVVADWEPQHDRSVLYWSKPDAPHWFEIDRDLQLVQGKIMLLADVNGALLVGTDRAIHIVSEGAPVQTVAHYGALPGTLDWLDAGQAVFSTPRGPCTFPPFVNLTDAHYRPEVRATASGVVLHHAGSRYYVCAQRGADPTRPRPPYEPLAVLSR